MITSPDASPQKEKSSYTTIREEKKAELVAFHLQKLKAVLRGEITPERFAEDQAEREIQAQEKAHIEDMTGLLTNKGLSYQFNEKLRTFSREQIAGRKKVLRGFYLMIDIDNLKPINDTLGHSTGSLAIVYVGGTIKTSLRAGDLAARVGGDEFAIILFNTNTQGALKVAERLRQSIAADEESFLPQGVHVTASIGITALPRNINPEQIAKPGFAQKFLDTLFTQSDGMLYQAKAAGRNRTVISTTAPTI